MVEQEMSKRLAKRRAEENRYRGIGWAHNALCLSRVNEHARFTSHKLLTRFAIVLI